MYNYQAIIKPHLCYATEIRSPAQKSLKLEVEQVHKSDFSTIRLQLITISFILLNKILNL